MVTVAIAGTGNIARQILKALASHNEQGHTAVVLSRRANPAISALGFRVITVDYDSADSLAAALAGVHTVISTISPGSPGDAEAAYTGPQLALLAAAAAAGVRRFAPSEWATSAATNAECALYRPKARVWAAAARSGLECTAFRPGVFMNFLAHGSAHPRLAAENYDGLPDYPFDVDVRAGTARIPGTGNERVALTTTQDVGRLVVAALGLPDGTWAAETAIVGWVGTYHDIIEAAEKVTGRKLDRTYVSLETIEQMLQGTEDPMMRIGLEAMRSIARGHGCPQDLGFTRQVDVSPMGLPEFLEKYWGTGVTSD